MVWKRNCPECDGFKAVYGHRRNIRKLCNACFNQQEYRLAKTTIGGGVIKCAICGETDIRIIDIEHKNGDGHKEYGVGADGITETPGGNQTMIRRINDGRQGFSHLILLCCECHRGWKKEDAIKKIEARQERKKKGCVFTSSGMKKLKRKEKLLA